MQRNIRHRLGFVTLAAVVTTWTVGPFDVARAADAKFAWRVDEEAGTADLVVGDQPVIRYMFAYDPSTLESSLQTYKVFHHVFGPGTKTLVTKGAGGHYPHHRGLYVGWNKTSYDGGSADFWHCGVNLKSVGPFDSQRHKKIVSQEADARHGAMTTEIHWIDKHDRLIVVETRTISVSKYATEASPGYGWQIDWSTKLESRRGVITLDGDRQHAGFQFRAANDVSEKNPASYVRPSGFPDQPKAFEVDDRKDPEQHINLGWLTMSYELDGQRFNVEYFENPSLPKPSRYSERPYGRFGAFFKTELKPDRPLTMKYRVNVSTGATPPREAVQKRYDAFVAGLK
jgi:hypothetical protein